MQRARTQEAKDGRRESLLNAALEEFYERGFAAAKMEAVAGRAGLSKGTVYLYFDSKKGLFQALIESLTAPNLAQLEMIAELAPSLEDAMDRIAVLAPIIVKTSNLPKLMKVLIGDSHLFPDLIRDYRTSVLDRLLAFMARVLEAARDRGEIEIEDPALTARLLVAPMALSGMWEAVFGKDAEAEVDLEKLFSIHKTFMLRALRSEGGAA